MQLHELTTATGNTKARRIGRGGKRGKTSGKGHKGQKARAGHKIRPAERDLIKKIPKLRGHGKNRSRTVNSARVRATPVNLSTLEAHFVAGDRVEPKVLVARGIVRAVSGRVPVVKILAKGILTKKLTVSGCTVSEAARASVERAGGVIV